MKPDFTRLADAALRANILGYLQGASDWEPCEDCNPDVDFALDDLGVHMSVMHDPGCPTLAQRRKKYAP